MTASADAVLANAVRDEVATVVAALHRLVGDFDVAEEAVQDAVVEALAAWRRAGVPARPGAWLHTAARRNAMDRLRRQARYRDKLAALEHAPVPGTAPAVPDERLGLLFACCHPALAVPARVCLTLRAVVGLTTAEIARAVLASEPTVAQRISRAKQKIVTAGIPLRVPEPDELADRLDSVLTVLYLTFNEGYLSTRGTARRDVAADAVWLATLVATALPDQPEALGLLALLLLQHAREPARLRDGALVLLPDQDRSRWDRAAIAEAGGLLQRAATHRRPGRFQLQAAIAAVHSEAATWADTDWAQLLVLYDVLAGLDPSPVIRLNRAVVLAQLAGPAAALAEVEALRGALESYHLLHATRAELLRRLGRHDDARAADRRALELTGNDAERSLLRHRLERGEA